MRPNVLGFAAEWHLAWLSLAHRHLRYTAQDGPDLLSIDLKKTKDVFVRTDSKNLCVPNGFSKVCSYINIDIMWVDGAWAINCSTNILPALSSAPGAGVRLQRPVALHLGGGGAGVFSLEIPHRGNRLQQQRGAAGAAGHGGGDSRHCGQGRSFKL